MNLSDMLFALKTLRPNLIPYEVFGHIEFVVHPELNVGTCELGDFMVNVWVSSEKAMHFYPHRTIIADILADVDSAVEDYLSPV